MFNNKLGVPKILFICDKRLVTKEVKSIKWNLVITDSLDFSLHEAFNGKQISSLDELRLENFSTRPVKCVYLYEDNLNMSDPDSLADKEERAEKLLQYVANIFVEKDAQFCVVGNAPYKILHKTILRKYREGSESVWVFNYNEGDVNIDHLVKNQKAITTPEAFETDDEGYLYEDNENPILYINGKLVDSLSNNDLLDTSDFARLLTNKTVISAKPSKIMEPNYYRDFLRGDSLMPLWYGYENGYYTPRDIDDNLKEKIDNKNPKRLPVILCGQHTCGKSVSLGAVAYKFYREKKYPVVFICSSDHNFGLGTNNYKSLEILIEKLTTRGAERILVFWDNNSSDNCVKEALNLHKAFSDRGKKVVVISTAYDDLSDDISDVKKYLTVRMNADILEMERQGFRTNLEKFMKFDKESLALLPDRNIIELMYSIGVAGIRGKISEGLFREVNYNNSMIRVLLEKPETQMSLALKKAGLILTDNSEIIQKKFVERFCEVLALVTKYGISVPYMMIIRYSNEDGVINEDTVKILRVISKLTFVKCLQVTLDDYYYSSWDYHLSFRTAFEANIYLQNKTNAKAEETIICELIAASNYGNYEERKILRSLMQKYGPNSERNKRSNRTYGDDLYRIAQALKKKRKSEDAFMPDMILPEITYLREYSTIQEGSFAENILREAADTADDAIEKIRSNPYYKNESILLFLTIELVSCSNRLAKTNVNALVNYQNVRKILKPFLITASDNSFIYNNLMIAFLLMARSEIKFESKLDYSAEIISLIESIDDRFENIYTNEEFNKKKAEVLECAAAIIGSDDYIKYFKKCLEEKRPDCIRLEAQRMKYKEGDFKKAYAYIEKYKDITALDEICLLIKLECIWEDKLFPNNQFNSKTFTEDKWNEINKLCKTAITRIGTPDGFSQNRYNIFCYFAALSAAHLSEFGEANEYIKRVQNNYSKRRFYSICNFNGTKRKFIGTITNSLIDNYNKVIVREISQQPISYYNTKNVKAVGETATSLEIALSFSSFGAYEYEKAGR